MIQLMRGDKFYICVRMVGASMDGSAINLTLVDGGDTPDWWIQRSVAIEAKRWTDKLAARGILTASTVNAAPGQVPGVPDVKPLFTAAEIAKGRIVTALLKRLGLLVSGVTLGIDYGRIEELCFLIHMAINDTWDDE